MLFDGSIEVAASPDEAMRLFMDIPRMAALVPGASIEGQDEDGVWRGTMVVAFGPKRIRFNGKVKVDFDMAARTGTMLGRGVGDVRGAKVESKMTFGVTALPASSTSTVSIHSDIALGGVLAEFARTGGPIVANALLREFSLRLASELAIAEAAATVNLGAACEAGPAAALAGSPPMTGGALRADRLAWDLLKHMLVRAWQRCALIFRSGIGGHKR